MRLDDFLMMGIYRDGRRVHFTFKVWIMACASFTKTPAPLAENTSAHSQDHPPRTRTGSRRRPTVGPTRPIVVGATGVLKGVPETGTVHDADPLPALNATVGPNPWPFVNQGQGGGEVGSDNDDEGARYYHSKTIPMRRGYAMYLQQEMSRVSAPAKAIVPDTPATY